MASILRVNTLTDASSNNSIATSFIAGGSAKAWLNLNGKNTISVRGSLNVSSVTDNGTGDYTTNWSTNFANTNYSYQGSASDTNFGTSVFGRSEGSQNTNTNSLNLGVRTNSGSSNPLQDVTEFLLLTHGDLS